jgi:hypothetical protein
MVCSKINGQQMLAIKCELVGRQSVVSDDYLQSDGKNICERKRFKISKNVV